MVQGGQALGFLDVVPGLNLSDLARRGYLRLNKVPHFPPEWRERVEASIGGRNAWIDSYGMLAISKLRFYSEQMREVMNDSHPWGELGFPHRKSQTLGAAQSRHLDRGTRAPGGPSLAGQRRPRLHALVGRSSLPVPG